LIKFHHTEKIAKLENTQNLLRQLSDVRNPGIEHLTQLKTIEVEVGSIYQEYLYYLTDSIKVAENSTNVVDSYFSSYFVKFSKYVSHKIVDINWAFISRNVQGHFL